MSYCLGPMTKARDVALRRATSADAELLGNLLELYVHDLSPIVPAVQLGDNGRFGYPGLSTYLDESAERWAWLIELAGRTAGFVLAQRGSPACEHSGALDVAEFFVLRRFRKEGVGRAAAHELWRQLPGIWTVRVMPRNGRALGFWQGAIASYLDRAVEPQARTVAEKQWLVFEFAAPSPGHR